jgi:hypothetical protein
VSTVARCGSAQAAEQEDAEQHRGRFDDQTQAVGGQSRPGGDKMGQEQTGDDRRHRGGQRSQGQVQAHAGHFGRGRHQLE